MKDIFIFTHINRKILFANAIFFCFPDVLTYAQTKSDPTNDELKSGSEIQVIGERDDINGIRLKKEEIKRMPGTFGDSLKAVLNIPGVSPIFQNYNNSSAQSGLATQLPLTNPTLASAKNPDISNSQRGFLVMRGGGTKANQFYYDGLPLTYPFHADGLASVINNNAIRSLEVYSGAYSARYGFGTGGVIAIEAFKKREDTLITNVNTFLLDSYLYKNITNSLSINVSGRKYYPNLVLGQIHDLVPNQTFISDYSDYQGRINWDIDKNNSLTISSFGTKDFRYPFASNAKRDANRSEIESITDGLIVDRNFRTDGLKHTWKPFENVKNTIHFARNYFQERVQNSNFFLNVSDGGGLLPGGFVKVNTLGNDYASDLRYLEDSLELYFFKKILKINVGGQYRETISDLKGRLTYLNPKPLYLTITESILSDPNTSAILEGDRMVKREIGYFSEMKFDHLGYSATLGVRRDYYDLSKEWKTNPRLTLAKEFETTKTIFFGGTGEYSQAPSDISQYSKKIGNPNLKMETSVHSNIGIEQKFLGDYTFKLEGYKNTFDNLIIQDNFLYNSSMANLNNFISVVNNENTQLVSQNAKYSNSMIGWSKGFELLLKKEIPEDTGFYGWIAYTNSVTKRNRNQPVLNDEEARIHQELSANNRLIFQDDSKGYYTNLYSNGRLEILRKNSKEELYDLDRTHILSIIGGWKYKNSFQIGTRFTFLTNYAYTPIIGSEQKKIGLSNTSSISINDPIYSDQLRSARLPSYNQLDLRFDKFISTSWGKMDLYFEIINVTANKIAVSNNQFTPGLPYIPNVNPPTKYINQNGLDVYKHKIPFFNFGIQIQF
ncbi:TonB-dependent receptor [Leptospira yasudae]|uniref:TonB-dependent receptor plug domain-containing protein n=1 Tax=Leptospira yasudae TaxID=2202201 RepID=UPI0010847E17|nr:TonB-dependent receptor [Leptospira yasudae]TGM06713.1 TonB-dependent receptor [Leptospira yasudae]